ncbi:hypothetical protein DUI87_07340 [Hirundo rustica rustica]|uniref:Uncharacterized protein n=1 Tax=Hirundo rustica rustica TaxID=333673 RepID=A0A3M0KPN3_HIRRU|nr:hypothetical protein DUI87_07340 [Hirundo rustica rustica]
MVDKELGMKGTEELGPALLSGCRYLTSRNIIVWQISLALLLMLDENQKKLAHFTVHQQAKNEVLVIAIASTVAKEKYQHCVQLAKKASGILACTRN